MKQRKPQKPNQFSKRWSMKQQKTQKPPKKTQLAERQTRRTTKYEAAKTPKTPSTHRTTKWSSKNPKNPPKKPNSQNDKLWSSKNPKTPPTLRMTKYEAAKTPPVTEWQSMMKQKPQKPQKPVFEVRIKKMLSLYRAIDVDHVRGQQLFHPSVLPRHVDRRSSRLLYTALQSTQIHGMEGGGA